MMPMISSPHGNKSRAIVTNADIGTNASLDGQGIAPGNVKLNLFPYKYGAVKILSSKDRDYLILDIAVPRHHVRHHHVGPGD